MQMQPLRLSCHRKELSYDLPVIPKGLSEEGISGRGGVRSKIQGLSPLSIPPGSCHDYSFGPAAHNAELLCC